MTHRGWRKAAAVAGALFCAAALTACPARRPEAPAPPGPAAPAPGAPAQPAPAAPAAPAAESARGEELAEIARRIPGVQAAWVVAVGQQAYVGLDLEGEGSRTHDANGRVEEQVSAALRRSPHGIKDAYVTTKPELVQSIFNVAEGLRRGQPLQGFLAELDKLYSELKPEGR